MQKVQFPCTHCRSMMGVTLDLLGRKVRCPHCQQVVIAPVSAEEPPPEPVAETNPSTDGDMADLFLAGLEARPGRPPSDQAAPDEAALSPSSAVVDEAAPSGPEPDGAAPWQDAPQDHDHPASPTARARRNAGGGLMWLWLVPLLSYAVLATVVAVLLWLKLQSPPPPPRNQLEFMPDLNGDAPLKKDEKQSMTFEYPAKLTTEELLSSRKTRLGGTIVVGSLAVTPLAVKRQLVTVATPGMSTPCKHESLVLELELRNQSDAFGFVPLDNFFDRSNDVKGVPPFTSLELGPDQRFYGGPAKWVPVKDKADRQWVAGPGRQNVGPTLAPGASVKSFVCTDGNNDKLADALKTYEGPLLWRVHVRCGPVPYQDKLVAATTVIGVEFTDSDYRKVD